MRFGCFSLIDALQIFVSLWLVSRALKKLILINFVSVLIAVMEMKFSEVHSQSFSSLQTLKNKYFKTYSSTKSNKNENMTFDALIFNLEPLIVHSIIM